MPVLEREKHNDCTVVQPEDSFLTTPTLLATALDLQPVANTITAASRCSSDERPFMTADIS
jgi:hypothetical protein